MMYRKLIICLSIIVLCGIGVSIYFWHDATRSKENVDPVGDAWAHLKYITENLHEWGQFSPRATELMEQLTPTWDIRNRTDLYNAIELLKELGSLKDPRSAEVFVNYLRESNMSGRFVEEALIVIGPPSVSHLIPRLNSENSLLARECGIRLLGIISKTHQQELGGAVNYIILPQLKQLAKSDVNAHIRKAARKAVSHIE